MKATGRAIERALQVALFFQQQSDCRVRISTGTADAIDDIIVKPKKNRANLPNDEEDGDVHENKNGRKPGQKRKRADERADEKEMELPEARIRHTNVIEVAVSLR